jgi:hypothetical protein
MIGYFYILTGQWSQGSELHVGTLNGVWEMDRGASQQDIYAKLFAAFCERFGAPADGTSVINYYVARNDA